MSRVSPFKLYCTSSPASSARTTRRYSRKGLGFIGFMPITRIAVWPVPRPKNTRPGASAAMLAMEWAVTGAIRVGAMETPVPSLIREVLTAANANTA